MRVKHKYGHFCFGSVHQHGMGPPSAQTTAGSSTSSGVGWQRLSGQPGSLQEAMFRHCQSLHMPKL